MSTCLLLFLLVARGSVVMVGTSPLLQEEEQVVSPVLLTSLPMWSTSSLENVETADDWCVGSGDSWLSNELSGSRNPEDGIDPGKQSL